MKVKHVNITVSVDVWEHLRMYCAQNDTTAKEILIKYIKTLPVNKDDSNTTRFIQE